MSEQVLNEPRKKNFIQRFWHWVQNNPVIIKEMFSRMRGWRAFLTISIFIGLLSVIAVMIYFGFYSAQASTPSVSGRKEIGQAIFYTLFLFELLGICLIAPSLTASSISQERENQTYDLLRTTLLSARSLVLGKLFAAVSFAVLILVAALPVLSIAFMFGGVTFTEFALGTFIQILSAVTFSAIGLFFSSFIQRSRISTVLGQSLTGFFVFGLPMIVFFGTVMYDNSNLFYNNSLTSQIILGTIGWLLLALSPLTASLLTEVILFENQSLIYTTTSLGGQTFYIPSPWIGFVIFYTILSLILISWTIRIVRRPEK